MYLLYLSDLLIKDNDVSLLFNPDQDEEVSPGGKGGAVTNWTSLASVFPSGMAHIQELLGGMPMIMHNRQWSTQSDYVTRWTDLPWYSSELAAVPVDPKAFFERFFTQQQEWGLVMYEQVKINHQTIFLCRFQFSRRHVFSSVIVVRTGCATNTSTCLRCKKT